MPRVKKSLVNIVLEGRKIIRETGNLHGTVSINFFGAATAKIHANNEPDRHSVNKLANK